MRGDGNRPQNQELRDRYCSPYIIWVPGGACLPTGERRGACMVLVGKPEGMRPLGRCRRR